jgi:hypothetical protein
MMRTIGAKNLTFKKDMHEEIVAAELALKSARVMMLAPVGFLVVIVSKLCIPQRHPLMEPSPNAQCSIYLGKRLKEVSTDPTATSKQLGMLDFKIALFLCGRESACDCKEFESVRGIVQELFPMARLLLILLVGRSSVLPTMRDDVCGVCLVSAPEAFPWSGVSFSTLMSLGL